MQCEKVTLVGMGLLGGSLGLAIKKRALAKTVHGYVRRAESIDQCMAKQVADHATTNLAQAVSGADLIILCTPIGQMRPLTEKLLPHAKPGAIITDVGSTKEQIVSEIESLTASTKVRFVGSHPMAGAEKTGVNSARHDLFNNSVCAITPTRSSHPDSVNLLEQFWTMVGAVPLIVAPDIHDQLVGRCSHLPHIVAAVLVNEILNPELPPEQPSLCGPGFRDTTRIASGSPSLWREICLANRKNLASLLNALILRLQDFREALDQNDPAAIESFLKTAQVHRDNWINTHRP